MKGVAYRIFKNTTKKVVLEGIVKNSEDTIYPAQDNHFLLKEFPDLPSEVELHHFNVNGLSVETKSFQITWEEISKLPDDKY